MEPARHQRDVQIKRTDKPSSNLSYYHGREVSLPPTIITSVFEGHEGLAYVIPDRNVVTLN